MLSFQKARQGFKFANQIANRSIKTISWYDDHLTTFEQFLLNRYPQKDAEHLGIGDVARDDVQQFIAHLQGRQTKFEGDPRRTLVHEPLSPFTIHGYVRALSAFFHWAIREQIVESSPMRNIPRPKLPKSIKPRFSEEDIRKLLASCKEGKEPLAVRNRAILLFLLDTGVRAGELCTLTLDRLDPQFRRCHVIGKGLKDRFVPLGARTRQALWQYVNVYRPQPQESNAVFLTHYGRPFDANKLGHLLKSIGKKAGVAGVNPHKFRHTAARLYLRNGGDVLTLQQLLGHEGLETTRIYAQMEQEDLERTHARVSPVDRWQL